MPTRLPYYRSVGSPDINIPRVRSDYGGQVDYSPLENALNRITQVYGQQLEHDRISKYNETTARYGNLQTQLAMQFATDGDPSTRIDRFKKAQQDLLEQGQKELDQKGLGGTEEFKNSMIRSGLSDEFDLRKQTAHDLQDQNEARLLVILDQASRNAGEGSPEQTKEWQQFGLLAISKAVEDGVKSHVDGVKLSEKFASDVLVTRVRRDIQVNPHDAEQALLSGGYKDLTPEDRAIWLDRAGARAQAIETHNLAMEARADRLAAKAEKEREDQLQQVGDRLLFNGQMTPDWILQHPDLSSGDKRFYYEKMTQDAEKTQRDAEKKIDPLIYSDLRTAATAGEDVSVASRNALMNKDINIPAYDRILNLMKDQQNPTSKKPAWQTEGEAQIKLRLAPPTMFATPADKIRQANALDEFFDWSLNHKDAKPEEAQKQRDAIIQSYSLQSLRDQTSTMPLPRNLVGDRNSPDIMATSEALKAQFSAKYHGDMQAVAADPDFVDQAVLIARWKKVLEDHGMTFPAPAPPPPSTARTTNITRNQSGDIDRIDVR